MSKSWGNRLAWLPKLNRPVPEGMNNPLEIAAFEAETYFQSGNSGKSVFFELYPAMKEAYAIRKDGDGYVISGGQTGVLYSVYTLIRGIEAGETLPEGTQKPYYPLRMINCWDNMDGTVERGYAGRSIWFENGRFDYDPARIRQMGRMLASVGINVLCINNVNVHQPAQHLLDTLLPEVEEFAAILRPFGVRLMLSVDFSMPLQNGLSTADPEDVQVQAWWKAQAQKIWKCVPDLAGFLVKADSEHRPGPNAYNRTHAQGANMLARAIKPFGGVLVWRAFVYNCLQDWRDTQTDRPRAAYDLYQPLDGCFDENVVLQVKYGPFDFQVREPVSPLLYAMPKTPLALEFQLAQEYTGHQIDLFAMPPLWREVLDQMGKEKVCAVAAVSNLGRDGNWFGHPFAALNLFAFGLYGWNPDADPQKVIAAWVRNTYTLPASQQDTLASVLLGSRKTYEKYTAPLGLCWMVRPESHYGPSPYGYEFQAWGTYNRADCRGVGIDRTEKGTGYACQYPKEWAEVFASPQACPDELLLFFHRLPYSFRMKDGRTLIQRIYDDHFEGCREAENMQEALKTLSLPEPDREEALQRMDQQVQNAREWRDVINTFFRRFSGIEDEKGRKIYD